VTEHDRRRSEAPSIREIAELTARLRDLTGPDANRDPAVRAAFLADKDALLARIRTDIAQPVELDESGDAQEERRQQLNQWHHDQADHTDEHTDDAAAADEIGPDQ